MRAQRSCLLGAQRGGGARETRLDGTGVRACLVLKIGSVQCVRASSCSMQAKVFVILHVLAVDVQKMSQPYERGRRGSSHARHASEAGGTTNAYPRTVFGRTFCPLGARTRGAHMHGGVRWCTALYFRQPAALATVQPCVRRRAALPSRAPRWRAWCARWGGATQTTPRTSCHGSCTACANSRRLRVAAHLQQLQHACQVAGRMRQP